jgi:hypothetical protein
MKNQNERHISIAMKFIQPFAFVGVLHLQKKIEQ